MDNRTQQRFDRSIRDALEVVRAVNAAKPRRNVKPPKATKREPKLKGRLFMDPETGATIWDTNG